MAASVTLAETGTEGSWPLPKRWCWAPLGLVVDVHDHRRVPVKSEHRQTRIAGKSTDELFPYFGATGQVGLIDSYLFDFPAVLLGEDGAPFLDRTRDKAYPVAGKYWVNNHAHILTPRPTTALRWLLHALNFINYEPHVGGTTRLKLTKSDLEKIPFPLAPLAEQHKIVAKVDALFAEIAEGEAALAAARDGLDTFRRSLLKDAVTGKLTKDWRAAHVGLETGRDLLARIINHTANTPNKNRGRRVAGMSPIDCSQLPPLPETWAWAKLGDLLIHLTSGSRDWAEFYDRGSKVFIMAQNVRPGRYNHSYVKYVDPPDHLKDVERSRVRRDDLLVTIVGANTGDVCRIDFDAQNYFVCQSVALVRPALSEIAAFLEAYLIAPDGGRAQMDKVIYGAGRPHLSFDQIESFHIPIPPLAEMVEILRRLSEASCLTSDTLGVLDAEPADAARLKQSILKAAFEGRLVPQDSADEPAAALLERLAATTTAPARAKRGRGARSHA